MLLYNLYMIEDDLDKIDRDFLCALQKLVFLPISIIIMFLVTYFFGGMITAIPAIVTLVIILAIFEFIEDRSND